MAPHQLSVALLVVILCGCASPQLATDAVITRASATEFGSSAYGCDDTIAVDPQHWRLGIGRTLMEHALVVLRASWPRAIVWTPSNYEQGDRFYRATGWTPLGRTRRDGREMAFGRDL